MTAGHRVVPCAYSVAVPGAEGPEAAAAAWVARQRQRLGSGVEVLVWAPDRAQLSEAAAAVHRLTLEPQVRTSTWTPFRRETWRGGIVLALSPDLHQLHTLDDHPGTLAIAVVAPDHHALRLWATARAATPLSRPGPQQVVLPVDLVVAAAISNLLAAGDPRQQMNAAARRRCVQTLRVLAEHGYRLHPDRIYVEAVRQGWSAHNAHQLQQLTEDLQTGARRVWVGHHPDPRGAIRAWRQQAADAYRDGRWPAGGSLSGGQRRFRPEMPTGGRDVPDRIRTRLGRSSGG